jgi:flagellar basal body-associated protein FliL
MADADDIKEQEEQEKQEEQKDPKAEKSDKKSLIARFLPWIILFVVVLICAAAGLSVGRLFAGSGTPEAAESGSESDAPSLTEDLKADNGSAEGPAKVWYYDLDPVVANLNEPTVTRYVRASLTFEMSAEMDVKKGTTFLDEKKPILINWLTVYLSSLGLEDIRGDKNLRSIQSYIRDAFNEKLFPDSKPQIKQVLIKEFPVQ